MSHFVSFKFKLGSLSNAKGSDAVDKAMEENQP
jgi:hypothetical protein